MAEILIEERFHTISGENGDRSIVPAEATLTALDLLSRALELAGLTGNDYFVGMSRDGNAPEVKVVLTTLDH